MRSDTIRINTQGNGFLDAVKETGKVAAYRGLDSKTATRLQLITEELLSLVRSVTGEMNASFWIETEGERYDLHVSTQTVMDRDKRAQLLSSSTTRKNEAARTFLGKLRDLFEDAMMADADQETSMIPEDIMNDLANHMIVDTEWDGYERSVLRKIADDVKISIRGGLVDMTVSKDFAAK